MTKRYIPPTKPRRHTNSTTTPNTKPNRQPRTTDGNTYPVEIRHTTPTAGITPERQRELQAIARLALPVRRLQDGTRYEGRTYTGEAAIRPAVPSNAAEAWLRANWHKLSARQQREIAAYLPGIRTSRTTTVQADSSVTYVAPEAGKGISASTIDK